MSEWISIPADALIESRRKRASETQFFRSPFDVPRAMRVSVDSKARSVTIDLRYIGDHEPTQRVIASDRVMADIGRHSGRIFQIAINTTAITDPHQVFDLLNDALQKLRTGGGLRSVENYDATDEAIMKRQPQLLQQISLAAAW